MAVLPLVYSPDPRLKIKSEPVEKVDKEIRKLLDDMLDTMYEMNGVGLAGVQVGVHKRVLVMDTGQSGRYADENDETPPKGRVSPVKMVNPEIIWTSEDDSPYEEGCLSFPGQYAEVKRPAVVKVRYLDENGEIRHMDCEGLTATCVQHEIDHLDGITFVDHISRIKRDMILRKMKKANANQ